MQRHLLAGVGVALTTSACDLSSKRWAIHSTLQGPKQLIPGALDLVHWENPGMAFSLMRTWHPQLRLALLSVAAVLAIAGALFVLAKRPMNRPTVLGIGLVMGGAAGNLLDRLGDGFVTDFLYLHRGTFWWPAFNVADIAISIGAGLLLVGMHKADAAGKPHPERPRTEKSLPAP
jgi:signal peptidase II